jgi:hypothetical protein
MLVLLLLAFLTGQTLGLVVPQRPLSLVSNDASGKLAALQSKFTSRMTEHKKTMAAHVQAMSLTLKDISSSFDFATLALFDFINQLPNLEEEDIPAFLNDLSNNLELNDEDLKQDVNNGLDSINKILALMTQDTGQMGFFLSQMVEEIDFLEQ